MKDNEIIEKYKIALVDEYYSYLDIIEYINNGIKDLANDMEVELYPNTKFNYPEFCKIFLTMLRDYSFFDKDIQDESILYSIFEQMMLDKILENIKEK